jgi:hypothetical protein
MIIITEDVHASNIFLAHIVLKIMQLRKPGCMWGGQGPAVAAALAGAEGDWAVADVGARAPQLAVEAAVPSHHWRLRVMAPLHPACMWQIRAWLDLQHVSNVNPL